MLLLKALKATGKPLVVVLIHGRTMTINRIAANADAVVDVLFGNYTSLNGLPG